jgi:hypothetical protein
MYSGMHQIIKRKKLVMLIDYNIDHVKIWECEGAMGRNGEKVIPKNHLTKLFE